MPLCLYWLLCLRHSTTNYEHYELRFALDFAFEIVDYVFLALDYLHLNLDSIRLDRDYIYVILDDVYLAENFDHHFLDLVFEEYAHFILDYAYSLDYVFAAVIDFYLALDLTYLLEQWRQRMYLEEEYPWKSTGSATRMGAKCSILPAEAVPRKGQTMVQSI